MPKRDLAAQLGVSRQAIEARVDLIKTKMIEVLVGPMPHIYWSLERRIKCTRTPVNGVEDMPEISGLLYMWVNSRSCSITVPIFTARQ